MPLRHGAIYYSVTHPGTVVRITRTTSRSVYFRVLNDPGSEYRQTIGPFEATYSTGPWIANDQLDDLLVPGSVWRPLDSFQEVVDGNPDIFGRNRYRVIDRTQRVILYGYRGNRVYSMTSTTRDLRADVLRVLESENPPTSFGDRPTIEAFLRRHTRMHGEDIDPLHVATREPASQRKRAYRAKKEGPEPKKHLVRKTVWDRLKDPIL